MTDRLPDIPNPKFHPSPAKAVLFAGGKVLHLNRATRRRLGVKQVRLPNARIKT